MFRRHELNKSQNILVETIPSYVHSRNLIRQRTQMQNFAQPLHFLECLRTVYYTKKPFTREKYEVIFVHSYIFQIGGLGWRCG